MKISFRLGRVSYLSSLLFMLVLTPLNLQARPTGSSLGKPVMRTAPATPRNSQQLEKKKMRKLDLRGDRLKTISKCGYPKVWGPSGMVDQAPRWIYAYPQGASACRVIYAFIGNDLKNRTLTPNCSLLPKSTCR